ncbi:Rab GDP dissociation inhibitor [Nematocida sp. LUAm3]|nr:Rab GDP dissociation inhibitor [Nematocida sp. LUAm3]KAI5174089.1 Rab GDP dissociation inhibitor [Nematocida sp. LUAm2]KAI5177168.1 Rab GDP dissociation inhibitor [Nematocida sp. LUAm1]
MTAEQSSIEHFDCVIFGTGIKESILAGLLSSRGYKILQVDDSSSYGSSSRTLKYNEFIEEMSEKTKNPVIFKNVLGRLAEEFYIDMTPKIFLAEEGLITVIAENNLSHCIEFNIIDEQYIVYGEKPILIPTTKTAALKSNLCGPFQLLKLHRFISMIKKFYQASEDEKKNVSSQWRTVKDLYEHYGITESIRTILGHGVALYTSDIYLKDPPYDFIMRLTTYFKSVARVNASNISSGNSPFLYPKYGISEISQGFARLSAVKGGTTRMNTELLSISRENSTFNMKIRTETQEDYISSSLVIANDRYYSSFPDVKLKEKHTIRGVYILASSVTKTRQAQLTSGDSDIFLLVIGSAEGICSEGWAIAYITIECPNRIASCSEEMAQLDIAATIQPVDTLLRSWDYMIIQTMTWIDSSYEAVDAKVEGVIPLKPMDETVDFRTVHEEVEAVLSLFPEHIT